MRAAFLLFLSFSFSSAHVNVSSRTYAISQQTEEMVAHSKAFILLNFHPTVPRRPAFSRALQVASRDFVLINNATSFVPYCTALQIQSKAFVLVGNATVYSTALQVQSKDFVILTNTRTKKHCTALQLQSKDFVLIENSTDYAPYCTALQVASKDFVLVGNSTEYAPYCTALQVQSKDFVLVGGVRSTAIQKQYQDLVLLRNSHTREQCTAVQLQSKDFVLIENSTAFSPYCTALQVASKDFVLLENSTAFAPYCTALQVQRRDLRTASDSGSRAWRYSLALQPQSRAFVLRGVTGIAPRIKERGLVPVPQALQTCSV
jgi:hypothetical protein